VRKIWLRPDIELIVGQDFTAKFPKVIEVGGKKPTKPTYVMAIARHDFAQPVVWGLETTLLGPNVKPSTDSCAKVVFQVAADGGYGMNIFKLNN